jgi:hypothetical protein
LKQGTICNRDLSRVRRSVYQLDDKDDLRFQCTSEHTYATDELLIMHARSGALRVALRMLLEQETLRGYLQRRACQGGSGVVADALVRNEAAARRRARMLAGWWSIRQGRVRLIT